MSDHVRLDSLPVGIGLRIASQIVYQRCERPSYRPDVPGMVWVRCSCHGAFMMPADTLVEPLPGELVVMAATNPTE